MSTSKPHKGIGVFGYLRMAYRRFEEVKKPAVEQVKNEVIVPVKPFNYTGKGRDNKSILTKGLLDISDR